MEFWFLYDEVRGLSSLASGIFRRNVFDVYLNFVVEPSKIMSIFVSIKDSLTQCLNRTKPLNQLFFFSFIERVCERLRWVALYIIICKRFLKQKTKRENRTMMNRFQKHSWHCKKCHPILSTIGNEVLILNRSEETLLINEMIHQVCM